MRNWPELTPLTPRERGEFICLYVAAFAFLVVVWGYAFICL